MSQQTNRFYEFGPFRLDVGERVLLRDGQPVTLSPKLFDILLALVENNGHILEKEEAIKRVWPDQFVEEGNLTRNVSTLRRVLGENPNQPQYIETIPWRGYRFIATVREPGNGDDDVIVEEHSRSRIIIEEEKADTGSKYVEVEPPVPSETLKSSLRAKETAQMMPEGPIASYEGRSVPVTQSDNPRRRVLLVCGMLVILFAGAAWGWFRWRTALQPAAIHSIAVLPFKNLSAEPESEYFVDGLTGELIRNLSLIEGLEVRSQTSSFTFKDKPRNLREVGEQLHANLVLEGSVLRSADKLRINAQLVRVADDVPLWSGRFDRELKDVFAIQDEISRGIVNHLRLKLGQGRRRYETSLEAYDLYLRARALGPRGTFFQRIEFFEQAIAKDPSFAPAYAGLASAYAIRSIQFPVDHRTDELMKMREASEKAIQLDPLLAEAHEALGLAYARDGQWEQSEKSFRRAIELDANRPSTYDHYAWRLLLVVGRNEEALEQMRVEEKTDPLSPEVRATLGLVLISVGRYDEAAAKCQDSAGPFKNQCLARARLGQGRLDEAIQFLVNDPLDNPQTRGFLGYIYARSGRREEAEKMAAATDKANEQALIFAGLGDKDRTFEALDRMAALGAQRIGVCLGFPELALLRDDPRMAALRKKVGLPR